MYKVLTAMLLVSSLWPLGCGDKGGFPDASPDPGPPPGGTISMSWRFVDGDTRLDDNPCQLLGIEGIRVVATPISDITQGASFTLDCEGLMGESIEITPARYRLRIETVTQGLDVVGGPVMVNDITVTSEETTSIPELVFDRSRTGSVIFSISAGESAGNCAEVVDGGAAIDGFDIFLADQSNNCLDATFDIPNPNSSGGVQSVLRDGCSLLTRNMAPSRVIDLEGTEDDCIDTDVEITIPDVRSGPARLVIWGVRDGVTCYERISDFDITGSDFVTDLGTRVMAQLKDIGGCSSP